jgi:hypothetical protein
MTSALFTTLPFTMAMKVATFFMPPQQPARLSKKLPVDYALKHHLHTLHNAYMNNMLKINTALDNIGYEDYDLNRRISRSAGRAVLKLFKFLVDPMTTDLFMYQHGLKEHVIHIVLSTWLNDNMDAYYYMNSTMKRDIKTAAMLTIHFIDSIPFVRHVGISSFKSVFSA